MKATRAQREALQYLVDGRLMWYRPAILGGSSFTVYLEKKSGARAAYIHPATMKALIRSEWVALVRVDERWRWEEYQITQKGMNALRDAGGSVPVIRRRRR